MGGEEQNIGKAYAFFKCGAPKHAVQEVINDANVLSDLELSLLDETENFDGDAQLIRLARDAKESGINYVLRASREGYTNHETAEELGDEFNNRVYASLLFPKGEPFYGEIVHKENGTYIFRE